MPEEHIRAALFETWPFWREGCLGPVRPVVLPRLPSEPPCRDPNYRATRGTWL